MRWWLLDILMTADVQERRSTLADISHLSAECMLFCNVHSAFWSLAFHPAKWSVLVMSSPPSFRTKAASTHLLYSTSFLLYSSCFAVYSFRLYIHPTVSTIMPERRLPLPRKHNTMLNPELIPNRKLNGRDNMRLQC